MLRLIVLVSTMCASLAWAVDSPAPGGKGSYSMAYQCIDTGSKLVPQVCVDATFHYELSAFMGEPLAHYGLIWRLRYFTVQGGKAFGNDEARSMFGASADRIAVMLQGTAEVRQKNARPLAIPNTATFDNKSGYLVVDIDSGVATRAGKMSWNVAGSPDWSKFLMRPAGGECADGIGDVTIGTNAGSREFVSSAIAKEVMKAGNLELRGREICRRGTLVEGLENLESAIAKICQSKLVGKRATVKAYDWCPDSFVPLALPNQKQDGQTLVSPNRGNSNVADILDEAASQSQVDAKLKELRAVHLKKVEYQCEVDLKRIQSCYASQGCAPKSNEGIKQCQINSCGNEPDQKVCDQPLSCKLGAVGLCFPIYCNGNLVPNPRYPDWKSCTQRAVSCQVNDSCISRCNPNEYSNEIDCVKKTAIKSEPTEADARTLVNQSQRIRNVPSRVNQPTNFLD